MKTTEDRIATVTLSIVAVLLILTVAVAAVRCHRAGGVIVEALQLPPWACVDRGALTTPKP